VKHPSVRELYRYWNAQRGLRAAPERSDIEPGAIRRALADTAVRFVQKPFTKQELEQAIRELLET